MFKTASTFPTLDRFALKQSANLRKTLRAMILRLSRRLRLGPPAIERLAGWYWF